MDAGIADAFTIVVTNVASTDDSGRVRILPYQPLDVPHGCRFCPANLCKGAVMDRWLAEFGDARPRCIYVGDGEGDFCPSMRLASTDVLCARLSPHDGLLRKIANPPEGAPRVSAQIHEWSEADDGASLAAGFSAAFAG